MYCYRLHAWWSTQSRFATLLSSFTARPWVGLQTLWRFRLKDLSIDEMVGAWYFGCLSGPRGLPLRVLLLRSSVLFTVESLSLLYLLIISWFICSRRWCIDKLGVFLCKSNIYVSWSTSELRVRLVRCKTGLSPPVKYFTDRSKVVFLLWIFFSVFCLLCLCACLFICALWSPADLLLSFVVSNCEFITFQLVSWVRCGTWLYRFMIIAPLLTLLWELILGRSVLGLQMGKFW